MDPFGKGVALVWGLQLCLCEKFQIPASESERVAASPVPPARCSGVCLRRAGAASYCPERPSLGDPGAPTIFDTHLYRPAASPVFDDGISGATFRKCRAGIGPFLCL